MASTTTISSENKSVEVGPGLPVRIIGERINPTGKKRLTESLEEGSLEVVKEEAVRQAEAGADFLDVNVGVPGIDEPEMMVKAVEVVTSVTDLPLVIDSSRPDVLKAGLDAYQGKALVNSVDGEEEKSRELLDIIKGAGAAVIGLALDENGIPETPQGRLEIAQRIVVWAEEAGIPREDVFIDCLSLSVSAGHTAGLITLESIKLVGQELGVNQVLGVSNISFGLPDRGFVNHIFLAMAVQNGLNCPIMDPLDMEMKMAMRTAEMMMGRDEWCGRYLETYREKMTAGS